MVTAQTDTSISFLGQILGALKFADRILSPGHPFRHDEMQVDDPKVSVRVVTASGDAYRVTVEWLSEDSP